MSPRFFTKEGVFWRCHNGEIFLLFSGEWMESVFASMDELIDCGVTEITENDLP